MSHFQAFDSFEAMQEAMAKAEDEANRHVTDAQRNITYGDYWFRALDLGMGEYLTIYGRCWTREEIAEGETEEGAPDEELTYTMSIMDDAHRRGYRFSTAYSQWEPDGEIGDVHISTMQQITQEQFEAAKEAKWPL
jgi:hypothetical protein